MMQKVNIAIPERVHAKAKIIAILKGKTLNEYLETALLSACEKDKKKLKLDGILR